MTKLKNALDAAKTHTRRGRDGASFSDDGRPDIKLPAPVTADEYAAGHRLQTVRSDSNSRSHLANAGGAQGRSPAGETG